MENIISISYPFCLKENHEEPLNMVCLNRKCLFNSLGCVICMFQNHKSHKYKPIKNLFLNLKEKLKVEGNNYIKNDDILKEIKNVKMLLLNH